MNTGGCGCLILGARVFSFLVNTNTSAHTYTHARAHTHARTHTHTNTCTHKASVRAHTHKHKHKQRHHGDWEARFMLWYRLHANSLLSERQIRQLTPEHDRVDARALLCHPLPGRGLFIKASFRKPEALKSLSTDRMNTASGRWI